MPQVHGASRNAWLHLKDLTETELNSVTDNPILLGDNDTISGGNFHGQPLALPLDYACFAAAEIGNISDRRCYLLLEGNWGLPLLLMKDVGLNSGFMIPQYTTAALVTENKTLCFPASADSIPTSLGQEDHVSMGSISGRKLNQVLDNLEYILAIELMTACQAIEFRRPLKSSAILEFAHDYVRQFVGFASEDTEGFPPGKLQRKEVALSEILLKSVQVPGQTWFGALNIATGAGGTQSVILGFV
jgi:histidine ammonia-lyase